MIDCREAVRRMWAYLDHSLERKPVQEFEQHLDTCLRCCGELEFNRQMRGLIGDATVEPPMPAELRTRIELLLESGTDTTTRGGR